MRKQSRTCRRGLTLVELMLSLAITALVGAGVASMLSMVGSSAQGDRDQRSTLLRAHAAQVRLRAYFAPALCVLAHDPNQGLAIWLHDDEPMDNVHLTELRVIWWESAASRLTVERVVFPDAWSEQMKREANVAVPAGSDWFTVMRDQRASGFTTASVIVDDLESFEARFNGATAAESNTFRVTLSMATQGPQPKQILASYGLPSHEQPTR